MDLYCISNESLLGLYWISIGSLLHLYRIPSLSSWLVWVALGLALGSSWLDLGAHLAPFGAALAPLWDPMGSLGGPLGSLGARLGSLGIRRGSLWGPLGCLGVNRTIFSDLSKIGRPIRANVSICMHLHIKNSLAEFIRGNPGSPPSGARAGIPNPTSCARGQV